MQIFNVQFESTLIELIVQCEKWHVFYTFMHKTLLFIPRILIYKKYGASDTTFEFKVTVIVP